MNERTRFPLHTERAADVSKWTAIGWIDAGAHPSLPGFHTLEWLGEGVPVAPFKPRAIIITDDGPVLVPTIRVCPDELRRAWSEDAA